MRKHYNKDGTVFKGGVHRMPNGQIHSGKTHTKSSKKLFHFNELSKTAQAKAKSVHDKFLAKKKKDGKRPQSRHRQEAKRV